MPEAKTAALKEPPSFDELKARALALVPVLRERAAETEALRRIPDATLKELHESGLFRMLQPKRVGGSELPYRAMIELGAIIARGCASTAWVLNNLASHHWMLAMWPEAAQNEIWNASPDDLIGSAFVFPCGRAEKVEGGYRLSGRWPFSSGVDPSVWNIVGGMVHDEKGRASEHRVFIVHQRDYTVIEAPFPTMAAMLAQKKADLITGVLPFSLNPDLRKNATTLFTTKDAVGVTQFSMWVARKGFIDAHRAAMVDFMEDSLRIVRWYLDPKNHKEVQEICSKLTKAPPERFGWVFTNKDNYRDPNMIPNLAQLQKNVDLVKDLGFVSKSVDVSKHADLSLVQEAAKRLK